MIALAAILFTSVGVLYDHGVLASNFPAANSVADDENIQLGDCNADGTVNAKDVIMLKLYLAGKADINVYAADANKDGVIDSNDISAVVNTVATQKTELVENPTPLTVTCTYPANGASVNFASSTAQSYYAGFSANTTFTSNYTRGDDSALYPQNLTFSWTASDNATSYTLYVSQNSDALGGDVITLADTSYTHKTLYYGKTYYWKVAATNGTAVAETEVRNFTTADGIRVLHVPDVSNFRDIGGYTTTDGYRVKQGMAYRGAALDESDGTPKSGLTSEGQAFMRDTLGINVEIDLRGNTTGGKGYSPIGTEVNVVSVSAPYYAHGHTTSINGGDATYTANLKAAIEVFANSYNYPIYFHCSLGRDRTGTLAFLIGGLLGVSERDLFMDYELSILSYSGGLSGATLEQLQTNINSLYNYLMTFGADSLKLNTERYLLSLGVSKDYIEHIRYNLLEGYTRQVNVEVPNAAQDTTIQGGYDYTTAQLLNASQASETGVPTGYSDKVLVLKGGADGAMGMLVDLASLNVKQSAISNVVFRVYCPSNVRAVRLTYDAGYSFIFNNSPDAVTGQWVDVTVAASAFQTDSAGYLTNICLGFRLTDYDADTTVYIDSITVG